MPRGKVQKAINNLQDKPTKSTNMILKHDPEKQDEAKDNKAPDLSMFKFEKKPHVKIEFEKDSDSPEKVKEEPKGLWEPANWKEFLVNLRNMRSNNDAPVDTMGCHMAMDQNAVPKVRRYQSLIALMLSSQTKDQVTFAAMKRLREKGLTVDNVLEMSDDELAKLIYPVGFWKTKVKYIKKTTQTLKEQYDGDIPDSVEKLCKLTGVGPKMAYICMQVAWNKTTGIGVDTHVHRISNRIGWVKKPTAAPEDTRKALQSWLPFDLWSEVNHLMVGFGQTICQPVSPLCRKCLNRDICPSSGLGRKSPIKKSPMKQAIKDEIKQELLKPDNAGNNLLVSPRKIKNDPVDKSPAQEKVVSTLKIEGYPAPSHKRKVTPKKTVSIPETAVDDKDLGIQLSVPKTPNKKNVSPKSVNMTEDLKIIVNKELSLGQHDTKTIKKSPKTKKGPIKGEDGENRATNDNSAKNKRKANVSEIGEHGKLYGDDCEFQMKHVKTTKSKKVAPKSIKPPKVISKTSQGTRKSARNKNNPVTDNVENNM